ncbi:MAG TPA: glycosyltransferase, partial [Streptosporangiaceae bacterium]
YALVKAAKVAVFSSDREGFGAAVLEALACGVPVVTTSSPDNLAQYLAQGACRGHVCEPSAAAIAATLGPLLRATSEPSDQVDRWLAEHSWDAVAEQVAGALGIKRGLQS